MRAETFFSPDEMAQIADVTAKVEKKTSGEVAVMVVARSESYPEAGILGGILIGSLLALIFTDLFFHDSLWVFVPAAAGAAVLLGWAMGYFPALKRLFVTKTRLEEQVRQRAERAFYEKGLYKTRDETGILFFISLFEHKVWVLADRGIYAKIAPEELQRYARDVARGVKQGNAAEILCDAIENMGKILAEHFPLRPDDTNEFSDDIILE
ncbi:MAG: hypothetical protein Q8P24_13390 [Desulfobacterales bacterium]|nr:hypothetical protein [Desulfobacterales bacterium]